MFESLIEAAKSFSSMIPIGGGGGMGLPIMGGFGGAGFTSPTLGNSSKSINSIDNNSKTLSTYYAKCKELETYENNEITKSIMSIYKDYLTGYFNTTEDLIEINEDVPGHEELQSGINDIFKRLDILSETKTHLDQIMYSGSYCFKMSYDESKGEFTKYDLEFPTTVVTSFRGRNPISHLVISKKGSIYSVKPESIFRIGNADLPLYNDIKNKADIGQSGEDSMVKTESMYAGTPLYYNIMAKIKEYLLKEQLISLISIKDLIQPYIMTLQITEGTSIDEGNKAARNVETMINRNSDISMVLSANMDINSLMSSISNNIKVFPDFKGGLGSMGDLDLSRITLKIIESENMQDIKRENIFTYNGIPRALYNGDTTKWEAIKSSQRLNTKINSIKVNITESLKIEARKIINMVYQRDIDLDMINVNLFTKTDIDYNVSLINLDIINQMVGGIQQVLFSIQQTVSEVRFIDPQKLLEYAEDQLKIIDPDLKGLITEETIKNFVSSIQQAPDDGGMGGNGMM
jgi:hypothetical protein|nr:MAG TPA: portal [Bacteriophage sp.]